MLGSFAIAQPDARVAPTMAQSPEPESVRSSTESLHMTLAQHLDVKESDDTELQALLSRVDGDVPDDDIDEDELALLEAQLGQKEEPPGALAALGAERCRGRLAVPEEADEDGSASPTPPPLAAPVGRHALLREHQHHLLNRARLAAHTDERRALRGPRGAPSSGLPAACPASSAAGP